MLDTCVDVAFTFKERIDEFLPTREKYNTHLNQLNGTGENEVNSCAARVRKNDLLIIIPEISVHTIRQYEISKQALC